MTRMYDPIILKRREEIIRTKNYYVNHRTSEALILGRKSAIC